MLRRRLPHRIAADRSNKPAFKKRIARREPMKPIFALLASLPMLALAAHPAAADVFCCPAEDDWWASCSIATNRPDRNSSIQVADGATVTLDASQVKLAPRVRADEAEYERIRPTYADTADAQWDLAQWCREHRLTAQRETHLRRVIELAPDHVEARRALGYSQIDGQWVLHDELMKDRGYRLYKGKWMLPQEITVLEEKRNREVAQQEWFQKLKTWRGWLDGGREQQGRDNILAITDPAAVRALATALHDDADPHHLLFVDALAKIDDPDAAMALAIAAIDDNDRGGAADLSRSPRNQKKPRRRRLFRQEAERQKKQQRNDQSGRHRPGPNERPLGHRTPYRRPDYHAQVQACQTRRRRRHQRHLRQGFGRRTRRLRPVGRRRANLYFPELFQSGRPRCPDRHHRPKKFGFDQQHWRHWYAAQRKPTDTLDARRN